MNISILSVFPDLYTPFLKTSLIGRAQEDNNVTINLASFFSYVQPKERIDASTFGPGAGMLIRPEVVEKAIEEHNKQHGASYNVFFSPQGKTLTPHLLQRLATILEEKNHILFVASRYEGMDARVEEYYADEILSLGNFVIMGGDLPVMVTLEGMLRFIPGIVGKEESVEQESFTTPFVDYPAYTQPVEWKGMRVPDIVRSGDHAAIEQWRMEQAIKKSVYGHFNWVQHHTDSVKYVKEIKQFIPPHYAALMHTDVLLPNDQVGTTSVTSLDIHDGARSVCTYDVKHYFIVTPLKDQQKVVQTLLDFWQKGIGERYNPHRFESIQRVRLQADLEEVIATIEQKEGKKPIVIATSAQRGDSDRTITYFDQAKVWQMDRPILFLFGTGNGLAPSLVACADFILAPIRGFSDFNHLSVRSAIAVVLDRWLGMHPKR